VICCQFKFNFRSVLNYADTDPGTDADRNMEKKQSCDWRLICMNFLSNRLKMLGLYLYTLIIGHKSCNTCMLSILNKLTLQKKLPSFVTNNVFLDKKEHNNNKTKNQTQKPLQEPGIELETSRIHSGCITSVPLGHWE